MKPYAFPVGFLLVFVVGPGIARSFLGGSEGYVFLLLFICFFGCLAFLGASLSFALTKRFRAVPAMLVVPVLFLTTFVTPVRVIPALAQAGDYVHLSVSALSGATRTSAQQPQWTYWACDYHWGSSPVSRFLVHDPSGRMAQPVGLWPDDWPARARTACDDAGEQGGCPVLRFLPGDPAVTTHLIGPYYVVEVW